MVEHCGGVKTDGNFVHALVLTDIATRWTECVAMPMRNQELIREALEAAASNIPFTMLGIDTDNDSAFINQRYSTTATNAAFFRRVPDLIARTNRLGLSRRMALWCAS